jgi:transketolase
MNDLSIKIKALLDTTTSTQDVKRQIKEIESKLQKTPIQLQIETNVGIAAQEMTKAAKNYEKVWEKAFYNQKLNAIKNASDINNAYNKQFFDNFNKSLGIGITNPNKITAVNSALKEYYENIDKINKYNIGFFNIFI